ncbi:MAG: hypothetical protein LBJ45_02635 [Holosporaceae bacterium]|nr:hypothetical protein [Holosporaceae bacterium]
MIAYLLWETLILKIFKGMKSKKISIKLMISEYLILFPILNYLNGLWNAVCISRCQTGNRFDDWKWYDS